MDLLKNCRKAEILTPANTPVCEAGVFRDLGGKLRLLVPQTFSYKDHQFFMVVFYDSVSGLINCRCTLSEPSPESDDQISLVCTVSEVLHRNQRRQDLKVPIQAPVELTNIRIPSGGDIPPVSKIPAITRDLSAGGIYFTCQYPLAVNTLVRFQFRETDKPLLLAAKVLRWEELKPVKGVPQFGHGCRFVEMEMDAESELRSFIFRKERQLHQNRR